MIPIWGKVYPADYVVKEQLERRMSEKKVKLLKKGVLVRREQENKSSTAQDSKSGKFNKIDLAILNLEGQVNLT
jgi:hypothetical protein